MIRNIVNHQILVEKQKSKENIKKGKRLKDVNNIILLKCIVDSII